jgi:hypothetical protein
VKSGTPSAVRIPTLVELLLQRVSEARHGKYIPVITSRFVYDVDMPGVVMGATFNLN